MAYNTLRLLILIIIFLISTVRSEDIDELWKKGDSLRYWGALDESKFEEAISYYDKVLSLSPSNLTALKNKADCLASLRRFEEAEKLLNKCLEIDTNYFEVYNIKAAIIIQKTGDIEKAKKRF